MADVTGLPEDVRALLAAVEAALDLPLPALTAADERRRGGLLYLRAATARACLRNVLDGGDPAVAAEFLRGRTAETPVTYTPWTPERGDGS